MNERFAVGQVWTQIPGEGASGAEVRITNINPRASRSISVVVTTRGTKHQHKVGTTYDTWPDVITRYYTLKETPMNPTIKVGDVFVRATTAASFDRIEILGTAGTNRFRAISTRPDGTTVPTNPYRSTLLNGRYRREEPAVRDFNERAADYKRPIDSYSGRPTVDLPKMSTYAIREDEAYRFLTTETATLIHVVEGEARQAKTVEAKRSLLLGAQGGVMLLAVPGVYSMDTFFIDNRAKALGVLGMVKHDPTPQPVPYAAADGSQWVAA